MTTFLSATQIHDGKRWLPEGSVIEIDDEGVIEAIHVAGVIPEDQLQFYKGIICPGFVNAHCHLELSHMKGLIGEGTGLTGFLKDVMLLRNGQTETEKEEALLAAIREMEANGIVALGDIANGTDTLKHRSSANFHIHTFVESTGFTEQNAAIRFQGSEKVYHTFEQQSLQPTQNILRQSIVPHAPYSVSATLLSLIDQFDTDARLSIHNQETQAENNFFYDASGDFNLFYQTFGIDHSFFKPSGKTSLQTLLPLISETHPLILVHNTFMSPEDISFIKQQNRSVYFCLCPNANWYIERKLPDIDLLAGSGLTICIGTDSLASNHQLSVWEELNTIRSHFDNIPLEELIRWATINGAEALGLQQTVGSLEAGKRPGLIHIDHSGNIRILYSSIGSK